MQKKQKIPPQLWAFTLTLFIGLFMIIINSRMGTLNEQAKEIAAKQAELARINNEIEDLRRKIEFAKTDEYIERAAREHFDLAYPSETRFIAVGE